MQQSVFISGAAQGIGAEIARLFYQQGFKVGIYDINQQQAQALAAELGMHAKAGYLDVSNYQQWQTALQEFTHWAGELNLLINNAGILYSGAFENTDIQSHHRIIDINIKGMMNGCHAALAHLQQAGFARVINLSSASAIYGQADLASYSASKFAVRGLTEALDVEWQKYKNSCSGCDAFICTNQHGEKHGCRQYPEYWGRFDPSRCRKTGSRFGTTQRSCLTPDTYACWHKNQTALSVIQH